MAMEQQPPPAAKFEDENSYNLATSGRCRQAIHTYKNYLLATVLLAWSFRKQRLFKAWLVRTTEHFLGLPMWKTRYFSQKEPPPADPDEAPARGFLGCVRVARHLVGPTHPTGP